MPYWVANASLEECIIILLIIVSDNHCIGRNVHPPVAARLYITRAVARLRWTGETAARLIVSVALYLGAPKRGEPFPAVFGTDVFHSTTVARFRCHAVTAKKEGTTAIVLEVTGTQLLIQFGFDISFKHMLEKKHQL